MKRYLDGVGGQDVVRITTYQHGNISYSVVAGAQGHYIVPSGQLLPVERPPSRIVYDTDTHDLRSDTGDDLTDADIQEIVRRYNEYGRGKVGG